MNFKIKASHSALFLLLALLLPGESAAEKLYRSRNGSGTLVFSDKPVDGSQVLKIQQVEVSREPCFSVSTTGSKNNLQVVGVNECHGPVEVRFSLNEAANMASDHPKTFTTVIPGRQSQPIAHLWQADRYQGFRYSYSTSFVPGDPGARHLPPQPYLLPVPEGPAFHISQGFKGPSTHTHPQSEYAVDIPMPEGTPIHAARSGIIMEVANDHFSGGADPKFQEKANLIRILHEDGTMALYAHLKLESIRYPVGTRVERGQFIAESGNTGFSSGPHLHFAIQKNHGMELRSIPFQFESRDGSPFSPERGMSVGR